MVRGLVEVYTYGSRWRATGGGECGGFSRIRGEQLFYGKQSGRRRRLYVLVSLRFDRTPLGKGKITTPNRTSLKLFDLSLLLFSGAIGAPGTILVSVGIAVSGATMRRDVSSSVGVSAMINVNDPVFGRSGQ